MIKQRGVAIITALFIMAIVALAASAIAVNLQLDINQTQSLQNNFNVQFANEKIIAWAVDDLRQTALKTPAKGFPFDNLPKHYPKTHIDNYTIRAQLLDAQARYNINNIKYMVPTRAKSKHNPLSAFAKLITTTSNASSNKALNIANETLSQLTSTTAALSRRFDQSNIQVFVSTSELRTLPSMSANIMLKLSPYIIALPEQTSINLNTATAPVLMMMSAKLTRTQAEAIISARNESGGFTDAKSLVSNDLLRPILQNNPRQISLFSNYFILESVISDKRNQWYQQILIQREYDSRKKQVLISVLGNI